MDEVNCSFPYFIWTGWVLYWPDSINTETNNFSETHLEDAGMGWV